MKMIPLNMNVKTIVSYNYANNNPPPTQGHAFKREESL